MPRPLRTVCRISIHALREEGDDSRRPYNRVDCQFLSTPSARRATSPRRSRSRPMKRFLSTPSARRATSVLKQTDKGDVEFLSTPSARRATFPSPMKSRPHTNFYPRPPRGGRPSIGETVKRIILISIHALREEGDLLDRWEEYSLETFLSTPSARRATRVSRHIRQRVRDFYPRPPRGGRRRLFYYGKTQKKFLSTPSARRATIFRLLQGHVLDISIHALREEGDAELLRAVWAGNHFYPRPPRGGRQHLNP